MRYFSFTEKEGWKETNDYYEWRSNHLKEFEACVEGDQMIDLQARFADHFEISLSDLKSLISKIEGQSENDE